MPRGRNPAWMECQYFAEHNAHTFTPRGQFILVHPSAYDYVLGKWEKTWEPKANPQREHACELQNPVSKPGPSDQPNFNVCTCIIIQTMCTIRVMLNDLLLGFCFMYYVRNSCVLFLSPHARKAEWLMSALQAESMSLPHGHALWPPSWLLCVPGQQNLEMALFNSYLFFLFLLCFFLALSTSMARPGTDLNRPLYTTLQQTFSKLYTLQRRQCLFLPVIRASLQSVLDYIFSVEAYRRWLRVKEPGFW